MGRWALIFVLFGIVITGCASDPERLRKATMVIVPDGAIPVKDINVTQTRNWTPLNRRNVLLGAPRPYLLVLRSPCTGLMTSRPIVIEPTNNRLYAGFDSLYIDGVPCGIESIYLLTPEQADWLRDVHD